MKSTTTTTTAFIFYLFLFAFTTTTTTTFALLRDVDGKILRNGGSYYIIPALKAKACGGGLKLAKSGNETCPLTVVQAHSDNSKGLPARLSTLDRIGIISKGHLLNIEFRPYNEPLSACVPVPSVWKLEEESQTVKVTVEKELDEIADGPFMILEHGDYYKLVYCDFVGQPCKDLGISVDNLNNRRLVVKNGVPLVVQFMRAHVATDDVATPAPNNV